MRKFVISDIHGLGNVYYSIMNYLDNVSKTEEIELYINGDLIDRGIESTEILLDILNRIKTNNYKIIYLGGNHEFLLYDFYKNKDKVDFDRLIFHPWLNNGGFLTLFGLELLLNDKKEENEMVDFISKLDIYKVFDEKINNKNIVLVHAACPEKVKDVCDLKIKSPFKSIQHCIWERNKNDLFNPNYFSIVGHTHNNNKFGFVYDKEKHLINIDGGCACYARGHFNYDHAPLVEIKDGFLKILTFNNNNEIIYGNYFDGNIIYPMLDGELEEEKSYLNKELKMKKLVRLDSFIVGYEDWK